jgi:hypothetical protein
MSGPLDELRLALASILLRCGVPSSNEHTGIGMIRHDTETGLDALKQLEELFETVQAEADVLSGRACAEGLAHGRGPCGACCNCLRTRLTKALRLVEGLHLALDLERRDYAGSDLHKRVIEVLT